MNNCAQQWTIRLGTILALISIASGVTAAPDPTIAVLIVEKIRSFGTGFEQPGHADALLSSKLQQTGFSVIDTSTLRNNIERQQASLILQGDENAARQVALKHDADYLLSGTASSRPAGGELFNTQMKSLQGLVTVKLIRNSDGRTLASASAQSAKPHLDELQGGVLAIEDATNSVYETLLGSLTPLLANENYSNNKVLHISGLKSFQHLNFIIEFLSDGISGVEEVNLDTYTSGVAELTLNTDIQTSNLALQIAKKKFKSFKIEPFNLTANRIDAKVKMVNR